MRASVVKNRARFKAIQEMIQARRTQTHLKPRAAASARASEVAHAALSAGRVMRAAKAWL
jgi:hypothetical protein